MVVPVLMTSCQVSENLNMGPLRAQITTTADARIKVDACPAAWDAQFAIVGKIRSRRGSVSSRCIAQLFLSL